MRLLIYVLTVVTLLAPTQVVASYIAMATGFSVTREADGLTLNLRTENKGDESAYSIQFEVQVGNQTFTSTIVPSLGMNESTASKFLIEDVFNLPGHYPVLIKIHYQDANTYPFTSLVLGFYDFQRPVVSKILIRAEDVSIPVNGKGTMKYTVRNNGSEERNLVLTLHLPDELAALKDSESVTIGPRESIALQYTIENFSALENSTYSIALVTEYEDGKSHYSAAGSGAVRIIGPDTVDRYLLWIVVSAIAVILVLLVIVRLRRK